jgi:hypothetical protein
VALELRRGYEADPFQKNLEDLDPEAAQEMKAHQAKITGVQNALSQGDFKAGYAAIHLGSQSSTLH